MSLLQKIQDDLVQAMKSRDEIKTAALRGLKAAIKNREIEIKRDLNDNEIADVATREVKKRNDAIALYIQGRRSDLANREEEEKGYLQAYLPEQLSEEELRAIVKDAVTATGAKDMRDIGKVMQSVMPSVKGKTTGDAAQKIAREFLG